jgi:hypothetical protein
MMTEILENLSRLILESVSSKSDNCMYLVGRRRLQADCPSTSAR